MNFSEHLLSVRTSISLRLQWTFHLEQARLIEKRKFAAIFLEIIFIMIMIWALSWCFININGIVRIKNEDMLKISNYAKNVTEKVHYNRSGT